MKMIPFYHRQQTGSFEKPLVCRYFEGGMQ